MTEMPYQHVFEHASDSIFILRPADLMILEGNRAAQRLTGFTALELEGMGLDQVCPFLVAKKAEILGNPEGLKKVVSSMHQLSVRRKDGCTVQTEVTSSILTSERGSLLYLFLQEITERRHLELQLRQAEKLSALGQLISGVAHELNNPLAVISGYAQLLSMRPAVDEKTRGDLQKIQRESERASRIVQNFLTFARKHPMEKTSLNLNELLEITLELVDYDLRASGVRVVKMFQDNLPEVIADPNQIEQVFLNVITNAVHAMQGNSQEKVITLRTVKTPTHVQVAVQDSGSGIDPAILSQIFDPFFTTKEVGMGTGLGLSISHSIMKEHGGNIFAQNGDAGGARFTIEFPLSNLPPKEKTAVTMESPDLHALFTGHQFDVLVVDDELSIQEVFVEMLAPLGWKVQTASNGLQALKLIERMDFDLIVCDLKMPGMDGRRLFECTCVKKPQLADRFVFITGDTNSPSAHEFLKETDRRWMAKPFKFKEVERVFAEHFMELLKTRQSP